MINVIFNALMDKEKILYLLQQKVLIDTLNIIFYYLLLLDCFKIGRYFDKTNELCTESTDGDYQAPAAKGYFFFISNNF